MRHLPGVSLQRKLLLWLLLPQLVLWLSGGFLAWRIALQNGEKGIDQTLTQSVRALARQIKPIGDGLLVDFPKAAQDILEQDPADRITYMVSSPPGRFLLGNGTLPPPPPGDIGVGEALLYHARVDDKPVRVALLDVDYGTAQTRQRLRVQVAQSLTVRERIAQELLEQMLLPMGLMGLALSALVYAGVLRGLQPLKRLEAQIERAGARRQSGADPLRHIELTSAPQEVHSLASTINRLLDTVARGQQKEKRFLNDAAHQLRTPLAGLIGQTELALHESHEPAVKERLQKVLSGAQRSAHLVHQLLQLARSETSVLMQSLDLAALARLDFEAPDFSAFPCLGLAYAALRAGGSAPAVLNAANEVAVAAFLDGRLPFLAIPVLIEATLDAMPVEPDDDLAVLRACDAAARRRARDLLPDMERA